MRFSRITIVSSLSTLVVAKNHDVNYDCSQTPQLCFNTCWALNVVKHPNSLHGGGGSGAGSDNREDWGYETSMCSKQNVKWRCPDGRGGTGDCKSIDEYPFAGSKEGGFAWQQTVVALRCIPNTDQSIQGGKLSGIATSPQTDTWTINLNNLHYVTGTNFHSPARTWCTTAPIMQNDGHQLIPVGGQLKLDDPNLVVARGENSTSQLKFSEDGNSATFVNRIDNGRLVPITFEA
ncbi:uncharacterized protein JN550_008414 [Neoarthrinium moseri]|uniref:uncharacterized protein n=1 Tax=Neoarthrinium moseri TaxID=1658444 RepID=UPI001FDDC7F4|nr:uncharacterized protein JN550_008414 [Neoarthrinium moseri]KAI1865366.1 hypothetical protein JN550_008414 [Neoarthrinium moseri]